jgi:hypothetical protein
MALSISAGAPSLTLGASRKPRMNARLKTCNSFSLNKTPRKNRAFSPVWTPLSKNLLSGFIQKFLPLWLHDDREGRRKRVASGG